MADSTTTDINKLARLLSASVTVTTRRSDGSATINLDAAGVDALSGLLDRFIHSDAAIYPDDDTDRNAAAVAHLIQPALLKLTGF